MINYYLASLFFLFRSDAPQDCPEQERLRKSLCDSGFRSIRAPLPGWTFYSEDLDAYARVYPSLSGPSLELLSATERGRVVRTSSVEGPMQKDNLYIQRVRGSFDRQLDRHMELVDAVETRDFRRGRQARKEGDAGSIEAVLRLVERYRRLRFEGCDVDAYAGAVAA